MENILRKADRKTSSGDKQYSMFIGRWQPWHEGHRWLIDQKLNNGENVLLCIRDVEVDTNNPWSALEIVNNLNVELVDLISNGRVKLLIIPDIESINFGRGVGYDIVEHLPPDEISEISGTKIREKMGINGNKNI